MDTLSSGIPSFPISTASLLYSTHKTRCRGHLLAADHTPRIQNELKLRCGLRRNRVIVRALDSNQEGELDFSRREFDDARDNAIDGLEPFRGKPGAVSFWGLTHQSADQRKLISSPFEEKSGSFLWALAPVALISSLVLPQFFFGSIIVELFNDDILSDLVTWLFSEVMFYIGLAAFFNVTDKVQRPYLQFSAKSWSLITGLRGYLTSAFFTMGFKVFAPLIAVYATWSLLGLPALISVAPFLAGCLIQYGFEKVLESRGSSSWPLVPIIFEVYRIYQLTRAVHFLGKLIYDAKGAPVTSVVMERNGALLAMILTFQVLGIFCLWSLLTFLIRLFPSRPVAENY